MEAAAQGVQEPGTDADADLLVHTLLAAWREEKAAMREEAAAPPACNPKYSRPQPFAPGCNPMRQAATLCARLQPYAPGCNPICQAAALFTAGDVNGDGELSLSEFQANTPLACYTPLARYTP
jgi:hypothetical protein